MMTANGQLMDKLVSYPSQASLVPNSQTPKGCKAFLVCADTEPRVCTGQLVPHESVLPTLVRKTN